MLRCGSPSTYSTAGAAVPRKPRGQNALLPVNLSSPQRPDSKCESRHGISCLTPSRSSTSFIGRLGRACRSVLITYELPDPPAETTTRGARADGRGAVVSTFVSCGCTSSMSIEHAHKQLNAVKLTAALTERRCILRLCIQAAALHSGCVCETAPKTISLAIHAAHCSAMQPKTITFT